MTGCGGVEYSFYAAPPAEEDEACEAAHVGYEEAPVELIDAELGHSVAVASAGSGESDMNQFRYLVAGAPDGDGDEGGAVRIVEADVGGGGLYYGSTSSKNTTFFGGGDLMQLGWSLEVADIRDCHVGDTPIATEACGQEILAGAPNSYMNLNAGKVAWYHATLDGIGNWVEGGVLDAPSGASSYAEFGTAVASWSVRADPEQPWLLSPNPAYFVAVGAPGDAAVERVYIYEVDSTATDPFIFVGELSPPTAGTLSSLGGKGFGTTLTTGDFDGDGIGDLAVGMPYDNSFSPGGTADGKVAVYRGTDVPPYTSGGLPFDVTNPLVLDGFSDGDHFGWALAAGRIHGRIDEDSGEFVWDESEGLVVGAPQHHGGDGAVCDVEMFADTALRLREQVRNCEENPKITSIGLGAWAEGEFGYAVAVGNFVAQDESGYEMSDAALVNEVAVGIRGR